MAENQCSVCVKISIRVFLAIINLLYMLIAAVIIGSGIFTLVNRDDLTLMVGPSSNVTVTSVIVIIIGVGFLLMSLLGLIGAIGNFWPLLSIYAILLAVLICAQITVTVLPFVYRSKAESNLNDLMLEYIKNYTTSTSASYNEQTNDVIDAIQLTFHCCGRDSYMDWVRYNPTYLVSNRGFPDSCECVHDDDDDDDNDDCLSSPHFNLPSSFTPFRYTGSIWKKGCNESVHNFIDTNFKVFGSIAAVSGSVVILTFLLSVLLVVLNLATKRRERYYRRLQNGVSPQEPSLQEITYTTNPMHQPWSDDKPTSVV